MLDRRDESNLFDRDGVSENAAPADVTSAERDRGAAVASRSSGSRRRLAEMVGSLRSRRGVRLGVCASAVVLLVLLVTHLGGGGGNALRRRTMARSKAGVPAVVVEPRPVVVRSASQGSRPRLGSAAVGSCRAKSASRRRTRSLSAGAVVMSSMAASGSSSVPPTEASAVPVGEAPSMSSSSGAEASPPPSSPEVGEEFGFER